MECRVCASLSAAPLAACSFVACSAVRPRRRPRTEPVGADPTPATTHPGKPEAKPREVGGQAHEQIHLAAKTCYLSCVQRKHVKWGAARNGAVAAAVSRRRCPRLVRDRLASGGAGQPRPAIAPPSELVIDGQTVRVASPDDANEIDLAIEQGALPAAAPAVKAANTETAAPADKSDSAAAAVSQTPSSKVGSASWLMQVMAALGAAVAAGSVAWFLIGSAPQRMVSVSE